MLSRLQRILLLALALMLAGCFRSAGENFVPTPTPGQEQIAPTATSPQATTSAATVEPTSDDGFIAPVTNLPPGVDVTATFLPITVFAPTRVVPQALQAEQTATLDAQATMGFITPRVPSGPITLEPPTTTPGGGALTSTPSGLVTPTAITSQSDDGCTYTVQPGDTLYRIATGRGLTLPEMRQANPDLTGTDPVLQPGQTLQIPGCGQQAPTPEEPTPMPPAANSGTGETYTVQSGDTMVKIAQRLGITLEELIAANGLADPDRLDIGQQLNIPPR